MRIRYQGYGRALTLTEILAQLQPTKKEELPPPPPPATKKEAGFSLLPVLMGAGAGFLVGGPVGALVGGGAVVALSSKK